MHDLQNLFASVAKVKLNNHTGAMGRQKVELLSINSRFKDRQQEAERHLRYLALLSSYKMKSIMPYIK